jgi:hypothetical protein
LPLAKCECDRRARCHGSANLQPMHPCLLSSLAWAPVGALKPLAMRCRRHWPQTPSSSLCASISRTRITPRRAMPFSGLLLIVRLSYSPTSLGLWPTLPPLGGKKGGRRGTNPLDRVRARRQPYGPPFFALTLQTHLEEAIATVPDTHLVAVHDDITLVGVISNTIIIRHIVIWWCSTC